MSWMSCSNIKWKTSNNNWKKWKMKIIFWWYLNRYYSMIFIWCCYKLSIKCIALVGIKVNSYHIFTIIQWTNVRCLDLNIFFGFSFTCSFYIPSHLTFHLTSYTFSINHQFKKKKNNWLFLHHLLLHFSFII